MILWLSLIAFLIGFGTVYIGCRFDVYCYEEDAEIKNKIKGFICDHSEAAVTMGAIIAVVSAMIVLVDTERCMRSAWFEKSNYDCRKIRR